MITTHVPLSAYGGATGATLLWARSGQLLLTAILKTQWRLACDAVLEPLPPGELVRGDVPHDAGPMHALLVPSDLSPSVPGAEILVAGHACAPFDRPTTSLSVRLFVGGEGATLVDKTLHIYGDRPEGRAAPLPFTRMPVMYERAVGGINTDNPVGRPLHDPVQPPNVVNPIDPWVVAGFAPVAAAWPMRKRLVRTLPVLRGSVLEIPDDLPLEYFFCAPKDQRVAHIAGDEWLIVDGMHPEHPRFQSQLPRASARARVVRTTEAGVTTSPLDLVIARVSIDMDRCVVEITWRGTTPVLAEDLHRLQIVAGVEAGEPAAAGDAIEGAGIDLTSETMMLSEDQLASALGDRALPWMTAKKGIPEGDRPAARSAEPARARGFADLPFGAPPAPPGMEPRPVPAPPPSAPTIVRTMPGENQPPPRVSVSHVEFSSDVTVTSMEEAGIGGLPFARAATAKPPTFSVPRMQDPDEDSEDSGGTTIAPIPQGPRKSALPFAGADVGPSSLKTSSGAGLPFQTASAHAVEGPPASVAPAPVPPALAPEVPAAVEPKVALTETLPLRPELPDLASLAKTSVHIPIMPTPPPAVPVPAPAPPAVEPAADEATVEPREPEDTAGDEAPQLPPVEEAPAPVDAAAEETGIRKTVLDNVRAGTAMHGMDLTSADLSGMDLSGAIFGDARLAGAKLVKTILRGARLAGARLTAADLRGADLTDADLSRSDLTRAVLTDAVLAGADLTDVNATLAQAAGASFRKAKAERAVFVQAQMEGAVLDGASMRDADFSGAFAARASFRNASAPSARFGELRAESASFDNAEIDGAVFTSASLEDASFRGVVAPRSNWERAVLDRTSFDRARLADATFARATMEVASLIGADLTKADLSSIAADGADFSEAKLDGCDLRMSKLSDARLENATLRDANAQKLIANGVRLEGADVRKASLRGARMKGCDLASAKLEGTDLRDADLEGAKLTGVDVSKAKLAGANLKGAQGIAT